MPLLELTRKRKIVQPLPMKEQSEEQLYDQAAELDEMRRLYEKGLDYC